MGQSSPGVPTSPLDGTPQRPGGIDFHLFHSTGGGLSAISTYIMRIPDQSGWADKVGGGTDR